LATPPNNYGPPAGQMCGRRERRLSGGQRTSTSGVEVSQTIPAVSCLAFVGFMAGTRESVLHNAIVRKRHRERKMVGMRYGPCASARTSFERRHGTEALAYIYENVLRALEETGKNFVPISGTRRNRQTDNTQAQESKTVLADIARLRLPRGSHRFLVCGMPSALSCKPRSAGCAESERVYVAVIAFTSFWGGVPS